MSSRCMSLLETFCPGLSSIPKHLEGDKAKINDDSMLLCLKIAANFCFGPSVLHHVDYVPSV